MPHSVILRSQLACSSPRLIAAYHDLHRLSMPRHPPCALLRLISHFVFPGRRIAIRSPRALVLIPHTGREPKFTSIPSGSLNCQRAVNGNGRRKRGRHQRTFAPRASPAATRHSRKEVIQPQVPLRLPCYDFAPVTELTFGGCPSCELAHRLQVPPASMA